MPVNLLHRTTEYIRFRFQIYKKVVHKVIAGAKGREMVKGWRCRGGINRLHGADTSVVMVMVGR